MAVNIFSERKLILGNARLVRGQGTAGDGKAGKIESEVHQSVPSWPGFSVRVPLSSNAKTASLSLEVECTGYVPVSVPVADVKKAQSIKTPFGILQFQEVCGTKERRTDQRMIWQVQTTTSEEYSCILSKMPLIRCYAFDAKGHPISAYGFSAWNWPVSTFVWEFWEEPSRIAFAIPGRSTVRTETFTFPDISLEPLPAIETEEGVSGALRRLLQPWLPRGD